MENVWNKVKFCRQILVEIFDLKLNVFFFPEF
jgi:hypothetical protein